MEGPTSPTEMVDQTYEFSASRWFEFIRETEDEARRGELWCESALSWGPLREASIVEPNSGLTTNPSPEKKNKRKRPQPTFVRIFSKQDEVALLRWIYSFASIYRKDPLQDEVAFCSHVKPMLGCEVSNEQIMTKYGNMKKKFKHVSKIVKNGKSVEEEVDVSLEDLELWREIWGGDVVLPYKFKKLKRTSSG